MLATVGAIALTRPSVFDKRAKDWTLGPVVYQIFVDRFASTFDKSNLIKAPRVLHKWSDPVVGGHQDPNVGYWTHELDFWGGDLPGITSKLDYIKSVGADVVYLTPIFDAISNHKYETTDYYKVSPEFGTSADFSDLASGIHQHGLKLMLDGVFNHVSRESLAFKSARDGSAKRDWFTFGSQFKNGYMAFADAPNMPTWRLENPSVRRYLWGGEDSVVRHWLRRGADGWRLDVAYELGPEYLTELTKAAHETKPGSTVVGEIRGYPSDWFPAVDGVMDFLPLEWGLGMLKGNLTGGQVSGFLTDLLADTPYENLLKSWIVTDNHDTDRLASLAPDPADRHLIQALEFTLPGSPEIFYGTELGVQGTGDPGTRAAMPWNLATPDNPDLAWVRKLVALRRAKPSLRYGDTKVLRTNKLLAYARVTDKLRDDVIVVVNPTDQEVKETCTTRIGRYMSWATLHDQLGSAEIRAIDGMVTFDVPPKTTQVFSLFETENGGYKAHHRIP